MFFFSPKLRVVFVCTANVCRSPLAEGILRHRLRCMGIGKKVQVSSAGTHVGQKGRCPDPRAEKIAAEAGVSLRGIRARSLTRRMIRHSDYLIVMERRHLHSIARLCPGEGLQNVHLLGSFLPLQDGEVTDIPDPYFGDWQGFVDVYERLNMALSALLSELETDLEKGRFS